MKPFLQLVADYLVRSFPEGLENICVVFPNKRASLYFNKHLAGHLDKPVWAPRYTSISELMTLFSKMKAGDPLVLVYELYKTYCTIHRNPEPFEQFYSWGQTILSDFDDIDKYLIDAGKLFLNLSDLKEIDERFDFLTDEQKTIIRSFWGNAQFHEKNPIKGNFLNFWQELGKIYVLYRENLIRRELAYEGMIYRTVAGKIKAGEELELQASTYCFIGFNALNECEKTLFSYFKKTGKALFFWDYDDYYIRNSWHEAGLFIRENLYRYPMPDIGLEPEYLFVKDKQIRIIAANNDVAQAKLIPSLIDEIPDEGNTAIVLADESLLIPVLSSLPEKLKKVNITMGYPFANSPAFTLLELVISALRNERNSGGEKLFFYREVRSLLNHPYIWQVYPEAVAEITTDIVTSNRIYVTLADISRIGLLSKLLSSERDASFLKALSDFYLQLAVLLEEKSPQDVLDIQYLLSVYSSLNKFILLLEEEQIKLPLNSLLKIVRQVVQRSKVSFIGEPLTDFQILGVLETRTLDFDHVIMLSLNEGVLPAKDSGNSFIPYNLRKALGMPTVEYHDAIYGYYFYRMLQRSKHITLLYNAQADGLKSGEMSRYLYQLKYNEHLQVKEHALTFQIALPDEQAIVVEKKDKALELLTAFAREKTFTPTSLSAYLSCTLKFYFQYLLGLKEKDKIAEDVEASVFGQLFHKTIQTLYQPYKEKQIRDSDFVSIMAEVESSINGAFDWMYPSKGKSTWVLSGKNLIIKEIIRKYVHKVLEYDKQYAPFEICALEEPVKTEVSIDTFPHPVKIGGYVDRMDKKGNLCRIIDYKTGGTVKQAFKELEPLFQPDSARSNKEALQGLIYAYVMMVKEPSVEVQACLFAVRSMFKEDFQPLLALDGEPLLDLRQLKSQIETNLYLLLNEIFDTGKPFTKTSKPATCERCSFNQICHR